MNRNITLTAAAITLAFASVFTTPEAAAQSGRLRHLQVQAPIPQDQVRRVATGSYYSPRLKARFVLQHMSIPGHSFWGARIVGLDHNSPLRRINLQLGDVVTRVDGIRISDGRFQKFDHYTGTSIWQIPQMEKHYGRSHVRFIRSGRQYAQEQTVDLGPLHCKIHNPVPHDDGGIAP